jgi:hypothetical protein|tara:strand:- start:780 stop:1178 length:399 start_codon:yes stop_codon:yes gene_type:complete
MENILMLWLLFLISIIFVIYLLYHKNLSSLILFVFLVLFINHYTKNMSIVLFFTLFIVSLLNFFVDLKFTKESNDFYHVFLSETSYHEEGISLQTLSDVKKQDKINFSYNDSWKDMFYLNYLWNKSTPTIGQ